MLTDKKCHTRILHSVEEVSFRNDWERNMIKRMTNTRRSTIKDNIQRLFCRMKKKNKK